MLLKDIRHVNRTDLNVWSLLNERLYVFLCAKVRVDVKRSHRGV